MDHDHDTYYHSSMTEEQQSEECCLLCLVSVQLSVNIQWRLGAGFSHLHTVVVPALSCRCQHAECHSWSHLQQSSGAAEVAAVPTLATLSEVWS